MKRSKGMQLGAMLAVILLLSIVVVSMMIAQTDNSGKIYSYLFFIEKPQYRLWVS